MLQPAADWFAGKAWLLTDAHPTVSSSSRAAPRRRDSMFSLSPREGLRLPWDSCVRTKISPQEVFSRLINSSALSCLRINISAARKYVGLKATTFPSSRQAGECSSWRKESTREDKLLLRIR